MQKIGLKIGGYITLSALDSQKTLISQGYLHGRKLYVGRYPKISEEDSYSSYYFPVGSVVSDYRNYVKNEQVEVEITVAGKARWYRVEYCEELSILSEDTCTSMTEMLDDALTDTETTPSRGNPIEDYSEYLETFESRKYGNSRCLKWSNCNNTNWILKYHMPQLDRCAVIDISCSDFSQEENIHHAQLIREVLNKQGYKPYLVAGHWRDGEPPYSAERTYIVKAADDEALKDFKSLVLQCLESTGNTAVSAIVRWTRGLWKNNIMSRSLEMYLRSLETTCYILSTDGKETLLSKTNNMELPEIYSHMIKCRSCPFHFDGMELPGSNLGRHLFRRLGIAYEMPHEQNEGMRQLKIHKHWWDE